jgi:hypothetical protein
MRRAIARGCRRAAIPLTAYYFVTLGLPLANGAAGRSALFVPHASLVIAVPLCLIVGSCALSAIMRAVCSSSLTGWWRKRHQFYCHQKNYAVKRLHL